MKAPLALKLIATLIILVVALTATSLFIECPGCRHETGELASSLASFLVTAAVWAFGAAAVLALFQFLWWIWKE